MTELLDKLDSYSRKARLYPALLVSLPVALSVTLILPGFTFEKFLPIIIAAGIPFFTMSVVRIRGQRLQKKLEKTWGGLPTTQMLRIVGGEANRVSVDRRRRLLAKFIGEPLPTEEEERENPLEADQRYILATRILIARVRDQREKYPRVHDENVGFGFWRNLLALKPFALAMLTLTIIANSIALAYTREVSGALIAILLNIAFAACWLTIVKADRVQQQGETYAERLYETLENLTSDDSSD